jgi:hypothetical protein
MTHTRTSQCRRPQTRAARPIALLTGALLAVAIAAPVASAKTVTMHLFSRQTSSTFVDAQGHPVAPNRPPAVGDTFDNTGLDYVGNHKRHAAKANGSDHLRCTITSITSAGPRARCSGQIAIGGSMLLTNDVTFTLGATPPPTPINGGTGIYRHARGLIIPTNFGKNTDFKIRVTY